MFVVHVTVAPVTVTLPDAVLETANAGNVPEEEFCETSPEQPAMAIPAIATNCNIRMTLVPVSLASRIALCLIFPIPQSQGPHQGGLPQAFSSRIARIFGYRN
jgi:hypothetical protein